ncbi:chloramphenicol-sensitive protein RarD [Prosthecobacter debontii]|uniref:Chloramphenicol-sensitive protein RarD n=2 Tax=Prosthecobacter debontii TaxID=48467 RepID=A0A1T4Z0K7_9BACT|nr:chloramphenicol-sensitive protein RarD [Prosthecobacter debontii]
MMDPCFKGASNLFMSRPSSSAVLSAILAFGTWGIVPVYWKWIGHVGADIAVAQRVVWTLAMTLPLLLMRGEWQSWWRELRQGRVIRTHALAAGLLGVNWGTFVWSALHGHLVECSLGYFLNPLLNVLIGCVLLGEKLSRWQKVSIALAGCGVGVQMVAAGRPPWIALVLAFTFGFYGLVRRRSVQGPLAGLATESILALPLALLFLVWTQFQGRDVFGDGGARDVSLVMGLGVVTTVPLLGFAHAARHLPFSLLGLLQFLAPTGQFLLGVLAYGEPLSPLSLIAFGFIWSAIAVFCTDLLRKAN